MQKSITDKQFEISSVKNLRNSQLDENVVLDRDNWAVTLICAKGSNHVEIIVEGVDYKATYFMIMAHFVGKFSVTSCGNNRSYCGFGALGEVKAFKKINPNKLKYDGKSETWLRKRYDILVLIKVIETEAKCPKLLPKRFNIFGRDSIFARKKYDSSKAKTDTIQSLQTYKKSAKYDNFEELDLYGNDFSKPIIEMGVSLTAGVLLSENIECSQEGNMQADNCFTWAREKLKLIDIELPSSRFSSIASLTRLYTNPGKIPIKMKFK